MKRYVVPFVLCSLLLVGAGCDVSPQEEQFDVPAIEAELGLDLPENAQIDNVVNIPGYYNIIYFTDDDPQTAADAWHEQLVALGYEDTIPLGNWAAEEDDPQLLGSYQKYDASVGGPAGLDAVSVAIGLERGRTKVGILRQ